MFSRMDRVENDWCNRLSRERLEYNLRIGENGPTNKDFDPHYPLVDGIMKKFRELHATTKLHNYPEKCRKLVGNSSTSVDVVKYCMSDFKSDSSCSDDDQITS